ncbi:MAG: PQQ-dependent sugar dehydrogenase [Trueperaceae bacterium]
MKPILFQVKHVKLNGMKVLMKLNLMFIAIVLGLVSCVSGQEGGETEMPSSFTQVVAGLNQPVGVTHSGDSTERLFVIEKGGLIRIVAKGQVLPEPFLDVSTLLTPQQGPEQGLLGLAFHPDYETNGTFFIYYTNANKKSNGAADTVLARYKVSSDPNKADLASAKILLTIEQPFANHNGGHITFGPDGYLYLGIGDGGDGGDPQENAENLTKLLGKLLRLDVNDVNADTYTVPADNPWTVESGAATEIWAYGLRNPWKFSFDRATGDLYIGDVGQNLYEEINFQPASSKGGENYGWNAMEGLHCFTETSDCDPSQFVLPILEYAHGEDGVSVTGGIVYRGQQLPDLQGLYFYADFASGKVWTARNTEGIWSAELFEQTEFAIASFGEDEAGEMYLVDFGGGALYRLTSLQP